MAQRIGQCNQKELQGQLFLTCVDDGPDEGTPLGSEQIVESFY